MNEAAVIRQTQAWVEKVIIGFNFCPFAKPSVDRNAVRYLVANHSSLEECLQVLVSECILLDKDQSIETSLLIFPTGFENFDDFWDLVAIANDLLEEQGYEGVYQLAHFHPDYCFDGVDEDDPSNYTNRSPYPMLHIIREAALEQALKHYPNPEKIPERNVAFAREKGLAAMQSVLKECLEASEEKGE